MKLIFTNHARERMAERRISEFLVQVAISSPDRIHTMHEGMRYEKVLPDGLPLVLGVVYRGDALVITTVFIKGKQ
jgi:hypothetical protein